MSTKVRWGIVSTGRMADWFCSDFGSVPDGELVAVSSRSLTSAEAFASRYGMAKAYGTYEALLRDPAVDIVYIATPHTAHVDGIVQAIEAGKHVLCEKPLVTRVRDAERVTRAAMEAGVYLAEAMWTWHLPAMQQAKAWVEAGRIGALVHVKTDFGYPVAYDPQKREYDRRDAGGVLREMGIYPIAIGRYFIGRAPKSVQVVHQDAPNGVEQDVTAVMDYGDVTATFGTSFRCRMRNAAYILGEEGYIVIPDAFRCREAHLYQLDEHIEEFSAPRAERGYHYQAIAACTDVAARRLESPVVPHAASLGFQQDIAAILAQTGRGEE